MQKEIFCGIKIYETARRAKSLWHMIWSSLDYGSKVWGLQRFLMALIGPGLIPYPFQLGNYNPIYKS
jgi:hypothetical protein